MRYVLDVALSTKLAASSKPKKHQCYVNSFRVLTDLPEGTRYVEGLGVIERIGIPLEHGWLELPDEVTVVDVTWFKDAPVRYYPVRRWTIKELLADLDAKGATLPIGFGITSADEYMSLFRRIEEDKD